MPTTEQLIAIGAIIIALPLLVFGFIVIHARRTSTPINISATGFGVKVHLNTCPLNIDSATCIRLHGRRETDAKEKHDE